MGINLMESLIVNVSLLLVLSFLYNVFFPNTFSKNKVHEVARGVMIGLLGVLLMMNTVSYTTGVVFDTRSILISVTGLFFGYIPTIIATVIISVYRFMLGGAGAFTGILVTVLSGSIGLIWYRLRMKKILIKKKSLG